VPDANLQSLRQRFIARTREDYAVLMRSQQSGDLQTPEMIAIVHRMAGTAGMLGYTAISAVAGRLDDELAEGKTQPYDTLRDLLATLEKTFSTDEKAC
jgi:HPt (histidine-containing phosphotransfer) domain-containing protein